MKGNFCFKIESVTGFVYANITETYNCDSIYLKFYGKEKVIKNGVNNRLDLFRKIEEHNIKTQKALTNSILN